MAVTIANRPIVGLETDVELNSVTLCHHDAPQPYPNTQSVRRNFTDKIWCIWMEEYYFDNFHEKQHQNLQVLVCYLR